jgi:signal transduction histidine kinase
MASVLLAAGTGMPVNELSILVVVTAAAVVGMVVSLAKPRHRVGRLMLWGSAIWGVGESLLAIATRLLASGQPLLAGWLGVVGSLRGIGWFLLVLGVPLVFPDGRTPWGGRRPVVLVALAIVMFSLGSILAPQPLDARLVGVDSPTGLPADLAAVADTLALGGLVLVGVSLVVAVAGLRHRWRSGDQLLRQQVLSYSLAFAAPLVLIPFVPTSLVEPWMFALVSVPLPIAIGTAIFQRRLYDTQLVVNRTLAFALLSAVVAGVYAAVVGGVGALLRDSDAQWLPWVAAGVVAVAFAPLRNLLQRGVNRLTYGQWLEPADVVESTSRRLADATDVPALLQTLGEEVRAGLKLDVVEITGPHGQTLAVHGTPRDSCQEIALTAYGRRVGSLRWSPPRLRPSDQHLLDHLAAQLGSVVHSAALVEELREAQERLVRAREDERRRLRRELHDGLGPTLAGLTLQVDTIRNVLAAGASADDDLLRLRSGVSATVHDVRRMVEGLRPAALDELGLDGALTQLAQRVTLGSHLQVDVSMPPDVPDIPAAVEVAAYRVAQEALTNAVRHSGATRSCVALEVDDTGIRVLVEDNGAGGVKPREGGIGLTTMHERAAEIGGRLTIRAAPAAGTVVDLWLPRTMAVAT